MQLLRALHLMCIGAVVVASLASRDVAAQVLPPTAPVRELPTASHVVGADSVFYAALKASSPELSARELAVRAAEARARAAGGRQAATLSGEVEDVPSGVDLANAGSLRIEIEQELLGGLLRSAQRSLTASELAIAGALVTVTNRQLTAALGRDLARLRGWSAISRRLLAEDDLLASAEGSVQGRFAAGDARYVDVLRLRTERLRVQSERATAMTEADAARTGIVSLLSAGDGPAAIAAALAAATRHEPDLALAPIPSVDTLLSLSAALQLSEARVARATAQRNLTIAEQGRRVTASVGAQRFQKESGGYSMGPSLGFSTSLPFTARKTNRTRHEAADLELRAEQADQRVYINRVRRAISIAHGRYESARNRLRVYEAALLRAAREERESALASFRSGELTMADLLDFERALARAEVDRIKAVIEAAEALADIYASAAPDASGAGDNR